MPAIGLPQGACLQPSLALLDVGMIEEAPLPLTCEFWLDAQRLTHKTPLFRIPGLHIRSWRVDLLHAWHIGPIEKLVGLAFNVWLKSKVFHPNTVHLDNSECKKLALMHIRSLLMLHYQERRETDENWKAKGSEATRLQLHMYVCFVWFFIFSM